MVESTSLLTRHTETYRGFESLTLRTKIIHNMNWKEFAKEQPEQGQKVIAAEKIGNGEYHYFIATYKMGNFYTYTQAVSTGSNGKIKVVIEGRLDEVTYWMPAPEAPTEQER